MAFEFNLPVLGSPLDTREKEELRKQLIKRCFQSFSGAALVVAATAFLEFICFFF